MENNSEITYETNNDVTDVIGYIAPYELGVPNYDTMIEFEVDCIFAFGEECVKSDWLESKDGRYANRVSYIDLSKKHPWLKWYYRFKLGNIIEKYGIKPR